MYKRQERNSWNYKVTEYRCHHENTVQFKISTHTHTHAHIHTKNKRDKNTSVSFANSCVAAGLRIVTITSHPTILAL